MKLYRVYVEGSDSRPEFFRQKAPAYVRATELAHYAVRNTTVVVEVVEPLPLPAKELIVALLNGQEWISTRLELRRVAGKAKTIREKPEFQQCLLGISPCCGVTIGPLDGESVCRKCLAVIDADQLTRPEAAQ